MHLPDVNVWLALAFESHVHHLAAAAWLGSVESNSVMFCRLSQQGFLRIATNPKAFGDEAVALNEAWELYDCFLADERIGFVEEPSNVESVWRRLTGHNAFSPKVWSDAYLAAFAKEAGFTLVTFDRGFRQFDEVSSTVL